MYNSSSVLKVAQNLVCNKFNLVHAQHNVQEINRTNKLGRIAIPSKISTTGWKELDADEYKRYAIKKHGVKNYRYDPATRNNLPDIYKSSSHREYLPYHGTLSAKRSAQIINVED